MAEAIYVIQSAEPAATLFCPARMRILEHLAEADSAAGIARRLGLPRQQVGYHMRELEQAGLVELVAERPGLATTNVFPFNSQTVASPFPEKA
jgi:DNA-binding transcriptional ArsR family regulator